MVQTTRYEGNISPRAFVFLMLTIQTSGRWRTFWSFVSMFGCKHVFPSGSTLHVCVWLHRCCYCCCCYNCCYCCFSRPPLPLLLSPLNSNYRREIRLSAVKSATIDTHTTQDLPMKPFSSTGWVWNDCPNTSAFDCTDLLFFHSLSLLSSRLVLSAQS